ncbi:MAG TPA: hypothetical protein VIV15_08945, partial [Anaerolineales bacterium]
MEIHLAPEHAYHLISPVSIEIARDRVEHKKMSLVGGVLGSLLTRSRPEDLQLIGVENRLEPFWLVDASSRTLYDRSTTYVVPASASDVTGVTVLEQELPTSPQPKGPPAFKLPAVEHCVQESRRRQTFEAITGAEADLAKHASSAMTEIPDLSAFAPEGLLVIPPQVRASAIARRVTADLVKPIPGAQVIHDEQVDINTL